MYRNERKEVKMNSVRIGSFVKVPEKSFGTKVEEQKSGKEKNITTKVLLAGLAALGTMGMYVAMRRKPVSIPWHDFVRSSKIPNSTMVFKAKGNYFVNGKAVLKNGKPYTGEIVDTLKNGNKVVRTYEEGLLKKAVKINAEGTVVSNKEYEYLYRELSREPRHFTERQLKSIKENGQTILEKSNFEDNCFSRANKIVHGNKRIYIDSRDYSGKPTSMHIVEPYTLDEKRIQSFKKNPDGTGDKGEPFISKKGEHIYFDRM